MESPECLMTLVIFFFTFLCELMLPLSFHGATSVEGNQKVRLEKDVLINEEEKFQPKQGGKLSW